MAAGGRLLVLLALAMWASADRELLGASNHKYQEGEKIELYANKVGELEGARAGPGQERQARQGNAGGCTFPPAAGGCALTPAAWRCRAGPFSNPT